MGASLTQMLDAVQEPRATSLVYSAQVFVYGHGLTLDRLNVDTLDPARFMLASDGELQPPGWVSIGTAVVSVNLHPEATLSATVAKLAKEEAQRRVEAAQEALAAANATLQALEVQQ